MTHSAELPANSLALDADLLGDFVIEGREHLVRIEAEVLTIERDPHNTEALNSIFRGFHTIKGLAGFLELGCMLELAHEVETILDAARTSQLVIAPAAIDVILQCADHLRKWLAHVEAGLNHWPSTAPLRDEGLLARVRELAGPQATQLASLAFAIETPALAGPAPASTAAVLTSGSEPTDRRNGDASDRRGDDRTAVRVDTRKLDALVDMVGELVIAESLMRHDADLGAHGSPGLQRKAAHLTRITTELQKTAMAMRLVPVGPLFQRMARLVRDLARQFGKRVELETEGDDTELDRTLIEELADPLMHMVRNALDHGIESPAERQQKGKDPIGRLLLRAQHQAGQVVIRVSDDGRGLDRDRIRAKAIERGLIAADESLSDSEVYNLIFQPGFTTAAHVTSVSGRGVGMDVVRRHVEKLRGRIEIRSAPEGGTQFLLKLPLTLAIIDGLVVGVGTERYVVPVFAVREMFRPGPETIWTVQQQSEMALVRGMLLPVLRLYRRFRIQPRSEDPEQSALVVTEVEGQRRCLLVDELIGTQEVVIKSLGPAFRNVSGISGGAILGDGRVGLILDVDRLFREKGNEPER